MSPVSPIISVSSICGSFIASALVGCTPLVAANITLSRSAHRALVDDLPLVITASLTRIVFAVLTATFALEHL
jgi:hypothetical protein